MTTDSLYPDCYVVQEVQPITAENIRKLKDFLESALFPAPSKESGPDRTVSHAQRRRRTRIFSRTWLASIAVRTFSGLPSRAQTRCSVRGECRDPAKLASLLTALLPAHRQRRTASTSLRTTTTRSRATSAYTPSSRRRLPCALSDLVNFATHSLIRRIRRT